MEIKGERFTGHGNRQTIEKPVVEGIPSFSRLGKVLVYGTVELLLVGWDSGGGRVHTKKYEVRSAVERRGGGMVKEGGGLLLVDIGKGLSNGWA